MEECVFCKILDKKKAAHMVHEDKKYAAFLDKHQRTKGHTLVIPRDHYRWIDEVPEFGEYFEVVKQVGRALKKAFSADWIQYFSIGEAVNHAHVHVLPRYRSDVHGALPNLSHIERFSDSEMNEIAKQIRAKMKSNI